MSKKLYLNGNDWEIKDFVGEDWIWRNSEKEDTRDVRWWRRATVPGTIQNDLLALGEIQDPYYGRNSLLCEWVSQRTWAYRKRFHVPEGFRGQQVRLVFQGIDYEGTIFLNGSRLGTHKSMFIPAVFDVADKLRYGGMNFISVVLEKAPDEQPQVGRTDLVRTHKSRMTYWWDFCPRMVHLGIWQDVYLEACGAVRINDCFVHPVLADDLTSAFVDISLELHSLHECSSKVHIAITEETSGKNVCVIHKSFHLHTGRNNVCLKTKISNPLLWHSNGRGPQHLYKALAETHITSSASENEFGRTTDPTSYQTSNCPSDSKEVTFGIRKIRFTANETPDSTARPYTVEENGERVYINGWNWVPVDVMYGAASEEKYRRLITLARNANVNMLRVWGGGLIEKEIFYDLCDRNGIMVWQEFIQSSSGISNKPSESDEFLVMMQKEAESIIPQKRNHPCLVMWCGGNELSQNDVPLDDREPVLEILRDMVIKLDPGRHWQPTSPQGRVFGNSLQSIMNDPDGLHDVHGPWEHQGLIKQQTLYNAGTSLLSSEFGVEGMANLSTLIQNTPADQLFPPDKDNPYYFHRGAWWINYELLQECFGNTLDSVEKAVKASQFLQAEGLRYAVESSRRRQYRCSGTLPWQFNEPFPNNYCTSAVDYYMQPKPAYYTVGRAYNPVMLSAAFAAQSWAGYDTFAADIWISNALREQATMDLFISLADSCGKPYGEKTVKAACSSNSSSKVTEYEYPLAELKEDVFLLTIEGKFECGPKIQSRYIFTKTTDFSYMISLDKATMEYSWESPEVLVLRNTGKSAALGLKLEGDGMLTAIDDNYLYLLPGEVKKVLIRYYDQDQQTWKPNNKKEEMIKATAFNMDDLIIVR